MTTGTGQIAEPEPLIPARIGRYQVRRVLGRGSMGTVYAAWDPLLGREVAIKVAAPHLKENSKGAMRFEREARAIAAIRHPNVVHIFDYQHQPDGSMVLVMEKLDGADLFDTMQRQGPLPEVIAAAIGHELCLALEAAHKAGILHRDLKPENVFITHTGRVVLTDFGIVKAFAEQAAIEGYREKTEVIGTPGFMAPEHMRGRGLGPSIDLFALGALLYNVVTLNMPFAGSSAKQVYDAATLGEMRDPRAYVPHLSSEFVNVLRHCLIRDPKRRPHSAASLRMGLQGVLEDLGAIDLRQDLADYVSDATAFGLRAVEREASHIVRNLKIAQQDHDTLALSRLTRRLATIAPDHPALELLAEGQDLVPNKNFVDLLRTNVELLLAGEAKGHAATVQALPAWFAVPRFALATALVLLTGFGLGHHAAHESLRSARAPLVALSLPYPQPPKAAPEPQQASSRGTMGEGTQLEVEVVTAAGDVSADATDAADERAQGGSNPTDVVPVEVKVDGYVVPGDPVHVEALNPGRHLLQITAGAVKFRRYISVAKGDHLKLVADAAHHLLMVR